VIRDLSGAGFSLWPLVQAMRPALCKPVSESKFFEAGNAVGASEVYGTKHN
jgi:hypothetical protein